MVQGDQISTSLVPAVSSMKLLFVSPSVPLLISQPPNFTHAGPIVASCSGQYMLTVFFSHLSVLGDNPAGREKVTGLQPELC